ncbi:hypothetical protein E1B28_010589 [Marasmius oreades]|uniref:Uncharacterized protein n=1 Tax=Marasmius oreades TaxID=181124 RepID=A0A9P7URA3_9AGAR|nr:uncharacterized protein E1B28_010589 [Marasmius oreades]KAG7091562.1 hypothetical protein E1B28_010589 [Marasmius oreades]
MGDVGMGIAYLCSCCCCCKNTDPGQDGSQLRKAKAHPSERLVDEEFKKRDYKRGADGRIVQTQPGGSSKMVNINPGGGGTGGGVGGEVTSGANMEHG